MRDGVAQGFSPALGESARLVLEALRTRGASLHRRSDDRRADWTKPRCAPPWPIWSPPVSSRPTASAACARSSALVWTIRAPSRATTSPAAGPLLRGRPIRRGDREAAVELQARTLLKRYGVVFRRLLAREANLAPWRELTRVYRRLEARGEIRGGRFVSGMSGEQFALAERRRAAARDPPHAGRRPVPGDQRRRSAEPRRHRHRRRSRARGRGDAHRLLATACRSQRWKAIMCDH